MQQHIKYGNLYLPASVVSAARRNVNARFNAASRSLDAMRNFEGSDYLSADAAMGRDVRRLISSRARNEFANNSFAYGIVSTLADDTIGTGPRLQLSTFVDPDEHTDSICASIERRFRLWAVSVGLNEILRCARIAKAVDGESFIQICTNPASGRDIIIEPRIFEPEMVSSDSILPESTEHHASGVPIEVDGITYDSYGNPKSYRFWRIHPGSMSRTYASRDSRLVPARNVIHYANIFRAGQHRGISEMTAALHVFNDLRRYSTAVVLAAEVAARLSFIISNDLPPEAYESTISIREDEHGRPITESALDIQGGPGNFAYGDFNSLVLPAGYRANQMKAEQPTQTYQQFRDSKINEAARVFSMPFNIAAGNSSSYNYASGRLDHQVYHKKITIERANIGRIILDPLLECWMECDRQLHPSDHEGFEYDHLWMWDGFEHVDPVKEAKATEIRLATGELSLSEVCAREGRDVESVINQRKRDMDTFNRNGLPLPAWFNSMPDSINDDEEDNEED